MEFRSKGVKYQGISSTIADRVSLNHVDAALREVTQCRRGAKPYPLDFNEFHVPS